MKTFIEKYYSLFLLLIIAFTFFTRMYRLHIPEKYIFDEVYHAVTAKLMVDNDTRAYEWNNPPPEPNTAVDWLHPPYAKLFQAASMEVFGKNSFGWRFSSVIFGCLVVFITAKIAEELFQQQKTALLSAFLVSLDGLLFTMSRIAMNDVHVTFFILLSFWLYLKYVKSNRTIKKFLFLSGLATGLAVGTKWSGVFAIGYVGIVEAVHIFKTIFTTKNQKMSLWNTKIVFLVQQVLLLFTTCILIPVILYLGSYSQMFLQGKDFLHLVEMHKNTWWYQTNLTASHPAQSKPWQWFLNMKPVWFSVEYDSANYRGDIYAIGNPALFWIGDIAIFVSIVLLVHSKLKHKNLYKKFTITRVEMTSLGYLLLAYAIVWLPWVLSPRIMFFYHYLPAVPLLTINLAYWIKKLWDTQNYRFIAATAVLLVIVSFIVLYPHMTLIPMSTEFKENVYFFFDFWKQG